MKPTLHFQRFEFKYPMHKPTADKIIPALLKYMVWDPYVRGQEEKSYRVNSLYFDNGDYGCFWEKEAGVVFRKKFRLRMYGEVITEDTKTFVEIKRKSNALIIKDRLLLPAKQAKDILIHNNLNQYSASMDAGDLAVMEEFFWSKSHNCLKPKIMITYRRRPLVARQDPNVRVTFDYDLRAKTSDWFDFKNFGWREVLPGNLILEIKYNNILPHWLHEIIQKYDLQRAAFSKYCNAARACVPQLNDGSAADVSNYLGL